MSSNFQKVSNFNALGGNDNKGDWSVADFQLKLIKDEFNELCDGVESRDINEVRDGIADVLVTVYGLAHRLGIDADEDMEEVCESNMSKFDKTMDDAIVTQNKYRQIGVETTIHVVQGTVFNGFDFDSVPLYVIKSSFNQTGKDGKNYPANKILKSHKFKEPQFKPLPADVLERLKVAAE